MLIVVGARHLVWEVSLRAFLSPWRRLITPPCLGIRWARRDEGPHSIASESDEAESVMEDESEGDE